MIWYCGAPSFLLWSVEPIHLSYVGSSKGRGSRAAGWFADHLEDQENQSMQSVALLDGIKGWATAGDEYTELMVEYDAEAWKQ